MKRPLHVHRTTAGWRLLGAGCAPANRFLERLELRGLAEGSVRTYAHDLLTLLRWLKARKLRVQTLQPEDLYVFLKDHRTRLKPATLNRLLRLLDRWGRGDQPACDEPLGGRGALRRGRSLPYVKEPRRIRRPLTDQQVRQFLDALHTHRDRAIVGLMWATGIRIGELLRIQLRDLDWEHGTLLVHGKGNRERSLPLIGPVPELLRRYIELERPPRALSHVFVVLKGPRRSQPMTYAGLRRLFRHYRHRLNLPEAHPHRFRHTFAANMARQGLAMPMLMRLMGHTWITTTLQYLHFDDRDLRKQYEETLQRLASAQDSSAGHHSPVL